MRLTCGSTGRLARLLLVLALAMVCGALFTANALAAATPPGLVAHYTFDASNGADTSGNANNGTLVGGPTFGPGPSGFGNALQVDLGKYVSLPSPSALSLNSHDFTVVAWVNATAFSGLGGYGSDWALLGNQSGPDGLHLVLRGGQPYMGFLGNDLGSGSSLSTNTWYQIAWQYQVAGGVMTMFLNGAQIASGGGHAAFNGSGATFIGRCCEAWDSPRYAKGAIDDVQIYNRALTPTEVSSLSTPITALAPLQTLSIFGGNGTPGTADASTDWSQDPVVWDAGISTTGAWHFTGNPSPVWHPAYLVGAHPWGFVPGSNSWINCGPTNASGECGNASGTVVAFRSRFSLPAGSANPSVKFWIVSDNAGTYYINGVQVTDRLVGGGGTGASQVPASAPGVPGVRTAALEAALHAGTNEMFVVVEDWGGLAGFNYRADITVNADAPPVIIPPTPTDTTPPVITPTVIGTLGSNGWYTSDIAVSWTVTDAQSPVTSQVGCTPSSVSTDTASSTFICTASSTGGSATQSVTLKRDATAPVITGSRAPVANAAGWNNTDVTASFACADTPGGSGIATNTVAGATLTGNGAGQSVTNTGACVDLAGNAAASKTVGGISIDKVKPVLAPAVTPATVALNGSASVAANATDALSGVASASCTAPDTSAFGTFTVTCTATDKAGNTQTATASYTVAALSTKQAVLAAINAEAVGAARRDASNLREAARQLADAVEAGNWVDGNHLVVKRGKRVFEDEKEAVEKLTELLKDAKSGVAKAKVQGWITTLVGIDRSLAVTAVSEATLTAKRAAAVAKEFDKAAAALAKGKPAEAIEHFKHAWQLATKGSGGDHSHDEDEGDDD